jgi:hypothetical protein
LEEDNRNFKDLAIILGDYRERRKGALLKSRMKGYTKIHGRQMFLRKNPVSIDETRNWGKKGLKLPMPYPVARIFSRIG